MAGQTASFCAHGCSRKVDLSVIKVSRRLVVLSVETIGRKNMRILLIDDDMMFSNNLSSMLQAEGFQTDVAASGDDGLAHNEIYNYQAIILDLELPDINGQKLLCEIRNRDDNTPVIILSGHGAIEKQLQCIGDGADDFMTKPFHFQELIVRLHALVRRSNGFAKNILNFGDVSVDLAAHDVFVKGDRVHLTAKEYQMFELLCLRQGKVVSKEHFLDHLYGGLDEPEVKIIDVFICKLRKKIEGDDVSSSLIKTVWGRGYRIDEMTSSS